MQFYVDIQFNVQNTLAVGKKKKEKENKKVYIWSDDKEEAQQ